MSISPNSPTCEYTRDFDNCRAAELEFVDVEDYSEGDDILNAVCFICGSLAINLKNLLSKCIHQSCEVYSCEKCLKSRKVRRGMKCRYCPARFWTKSRLWWKCPVCFDVQCRSCRPFHRPCRHRYGVHLFN